MPDTPISATDPEGGPSEATDLTDDQKLGLLASKTLRGDVADFLLDRLKHDHHPLPWNMRGEAEQNEVIDAAYSAAGTLVQKVVEIVMSGGRRTLMVTIKKAAIKDVIACEFHIEKTHEDRHELLDSVGDVVMLTLADHEGFMGERSRPKATPDQAALFPGGNPEGPDDGPIFDQTPSGRPS